MRSRTVSGRPSTSSSSSLHESLKLLRIAERELEREEKTAVTTHKQVWIPEEGVAFRLVDFVEKKGDDIIVGFINQKGLYEKKSVEAALVNPTTEKSFQDDLCDIGEPNSATILHSLSIRYAHNVIHTNCGLFCIVVNPWRDIDLYSPIIRQAYRLGIERNLPPHIYNIAQNALNGTAHGVRSQSILITGESGSGKTENTKRIIEYIVGGGEGTKDARILEFTQLLEAFGNAKTIHNDNSSRFGKFIRMFLSQEAKLQSAQVECYLLEKSRVVAQENGERGFHIFYQLLSEATSDEMKNMLHLNAAKYKFLNEDLDNTIDDVNEFENTNNHLAHLGIDHLTRLRIYQVVAACLLLGNIEFDERTGMDISFVKSRQELAWVAELLGLRPEALDNALTNPEMEVNGRTVKKNQSLAKTVASAAAVAKLIYERMFNWILERCNDAIKAASSSHSTGEGLYIGVLDMAGFEINAVNSFEQLCINYTNERLQQLFNTYMYYKEKKEYQDEGIEWECENFAADLEPTITLCEQPLGIFSLLEEECVVPNGAESRFLDKILDMHKGHSSLRKAKHSQKGEKTLTVKHFALKHYAGMVDYNVDRWLDKNKDTVDRGFMEVLSQSSHPILKGFFNKEETVTVTMDSKKRRSSFSKAPSCNTVSFVYRQQLTVLINLLECSHSHFIRCILPNRECKPLKMDRPLVLHQLNCNGVLEGVRIFRKGYPTRIYFQDFISRYRILSSNSKRLTWEGREAALCLCEEILSDQRDNFRVGNKRVLFKVGVVAELEARRSDRIGSLLIGLQGYIRWNLAQIEYRRKDKLLEAQLIVQQNVRRFASLAGWEWYRIWTLVRPLIDLEKTKHKLERAETELDRLRAELMERNSDYSRSLETMDALRDELDTTRAREAEAARKAGEMHHMSKQEREDMEEDMRRTEHTLGLLELRFADQHEKVTKMNDNLRDYERTIEILQMEKAQLEKEVKRLADLLEKERAEREKMDKQCREMMAKMELMTATIERGNQERNDVHLLLAKAKAENDERLEREKRQDNTINELQRTISDMAERVSRADGIVNDEKRKRRNAEAALDDMKDLLSDREKRIAKLKEKCDLMKEQGREGEKKIRQLEKRLEEKEAVMKECLEQLKQSHKEKVSEMNTMVDDLKRKNSKLENEKASRSMQDSIFDRESSTDSDYGASSAYTLRRSSSRLSRQTSFSSMSMSSLSLGSLRPLSRRMTEPVPEYSVPLTRSPSMLLDAERRITELERLNHNLMTELALAKREIEVYKTTIDTMENEERSMRNQLKTALQRADDDEKRLIEEQGKGISLEVRLQKALADVEEWKKRCEDSATMHSNEIVTHRHALPAPIQHIVCSFRKKLLQRIETLEDDKRKVEQKWTAAENVSEELKRDVERMEGQIERFKEMLSEADKCTSTTMTVGENWQSRCHAAENELQSLRDDNGMLKGKIHRLHRQITLLTQQDDTSEIMTLMASKIDQRENGYEPIHAR